MRPDTTAIPRYGGVLQRDEIIFPKISEENSTGRPQLFLPPKQVCLSAVSPSQEELAANQGEG